MAPGPSGPLELLELEAGEKAPRRRLSSRDGPLLGGEKGRQEAESLAPAFGLRPSGETPDLSDQLSDVVSVPGPVLELHEQREEIARRRHRVTGELEAVAQVARDDARRVKPRGAGCSGVPEPPGGAPETPPDGFREPLLGGRVHGSGERERLVRVSNDIGVGGGDVSLDGGLLG